MMNATAFETIFVQAETMTMLVDSGPLTLPRTEAANPERDAGEIEDGVVTFNDFGIRPGYSGDGYVDINGNDGGPKIEFTLDAPAGTYDLAIRYGNGSGSQTRPITIVQDGVAAGTIGDTRTGAWYVWEQDTITVTLPGGPTTFTIDTAGANGPNIDAVALSAPGIPVDFTAPDLAVTGFTVDGSGTEVGTLTGLDPEGDALTYAITGGADAALFTIDAANTLSFLTAPTDVALRTVYDVEVTVSDGEGSTVESIAVTVEPSGPPPQPVIDQAILQTAAEIISDADGDPIPEGGSRTQFRDADNIEAGKASNREGFSGEGYLDFGSTPGDRSVFTVEVAEAGAYALTVRYASNSDRPLALAINDVAQEDLAMLATGIPASGGAPAVEGFDNWALETRSVVLETGTNTIELAIPAGANTGPNVDALAVTTVGDAPSFFAPVITSDASFAVEEGGTAIGQVVATDDDPEAALTFALTGPDADALAIDAAGNLSFATAPDHGSPADADRDNVYSATVTVSDGTTETTQDVAVAVSDVDAAATAVTVTPVAFDENADGAVVGIVAVSDPDSVYTAADLSVPAGSVFELADVDGAVVVRLKAGESLDFEAATQPSVVVTLDAAALSSDPFTPAPGDVAEDAPATAVTVTAVAFDENAEGAVVGTVAVADPDSIYTAADLSVTPDSVFELVDEDDEIVLRLKAGESLDFEAASQPSAVVTLDAAGLASDAFTPQPSDVDEPTGEVAFNIDTLASYANQDRPAEGGAGASVSDDGRSLTLEGNLWKRAALPASYTITDDTRIEVELDVSAHPAEITGMGFDLNNKFSDAKTNFQLAGTQNIGRGFVDLRGTGETTPEGTLRFVLDLSAHADTVIDSLTFVSDHDSPGTAGHARSTFSNVRIFEQTDTPDANTAPRPVGGGIADLEALQGGDVEIDIAFTDAEGDALRYEFAIRDAAGADVTAAFDDLAIVDGTLAGSVPSAVAAGAYTVTVTATEAATADPLSGTDVFVLTVSDVNDAPVSTDPALEPFFGEAGRPLDVGFFLDDFAAYFDDPDGDALTFSVDPASLPTGVTLNDEGALVGTPAQGGTYAVTVNATDPDGLSASVTVDLVIDGPQIGRETVIEAEDFTGLADATGFFGTASAVASGEAIIRSRSEAASSVETDLFAGGLAEGFYRVAIDVFDELDGSATYSLTVAGTPLAVDATFDEAGTFLNPDAPRGGSGQAGNIKRIAFDEPVFVSAGSTALLTGVADGELLRVDRMIFTRIDEPNVAPGAPTLDAQPILEGDVGAVAGTLSAVDPDGDDAGVTFSTDDPRFVVDGATLRLADGAALDFEAGATVDVVVIATDEDGGSTPATLTLAVTDVDEAPDAPTLDAASVDENAAGATVGTLTALDPEGGGVTFTVDPASDFEVAGGVLKLKDGIALDHEAGETVTLDVTATDAGGNAVTETVAIAVSDVNDAPTLADGAALAATTLRNGIGGAIDLAALGAADEDEGQTPVYGLRGADGATLPAGLTVIGGTLTVDPSVPAGTYAIDVFATDGTLESAAVRLDLTVGEPAPFVPFTVEPSDAIVTLSDNPDGDTTVTKHVDRDDPDDAESPGSSKILDGGIRAGYSGTGYVDFGDDPGDAATFTFTVPSAGEYDLNIRYASQNSGGSARVLDVAINGGDAVTTTFPSTGPGNGPAAQQGFNTWGFLTQTVTLAPGENTVVLSIASGTSAGPNVDRIEITEAGTGPIPVDDSADADAFPLELGGEAGPLTATELASLNLNVTGVDGDVIKVEVSFDGGATRRDVTAIVDPDGDFVLDATGLAPGAQTATVIVTDAAGNEARDDLAFTVAAPDTGSFDPVTIQAEDATRVGIIDPDTATGLGTPETTQVIDETNSGAFGDLWPGATGNAYVDLGNDPGDGIAISLTVPSDGTYTAAIRYANGGGSDRPMSISVNGAASGSVPFSPTPGQDGASGWQAWTEVEVELDLTAGPNVVTFAIPAGGDNGPNIDEVTFTATDMDTGNTGDDAQRFVDVVKINFEALAEGNGAFDAPAGYQTPDGFEADAGAAFGDRGNGFDYGWVGIENGAVTGTPQAQPTGSARYKNDVPGASDLQKTYLHFDYPGGGANAERAWEMEVANGTYELTVAIGDTGGRHDSTYRLNVEGLQFGPEWVPVNLAGEQLDQPGEYDAAFDGEGLRSNLYTGVVQVTDGRLTLDGIDGDNVEIQWLELQQIPDLTPGDGRTADLDYSKFVSGVAASTADGQVSIEIDENGNAPLGIDPTSDIVLGVQLQAIDHRGPAVAFTDGVKLIETLTGAEVAVNVQVTGGADSLTIRPLEDLKAFTSYSLVVEDVLDLGNLNDGTQPLRQFQDYTTTFVTGEAPEVTDREVAFTDEVVLDGFADGGVALTSVEFGPDGRLYASSIDGSIKRWDLNPDGTLDKGSVEELALGYFQDTGRSIIGLAFDPEDPNTIWVTDNAPVPRQGRSDEIPEFSGQVSKIALGAGGSFDGAVAETYITGLPRSGGDHVTNSIEFRANPAAGQPDEPNFLLYFSQGSNSAAGRADNAWGNRPERLLNAAILEVDHTRDAPDGGFDVQTEPFQGTDPTFRTSDPFNADGTFTGFYDPFADGAVLRIFGEGVRNAYDLVWHSNGQLYVPTNGTARGGNTPDDPNTPQNEAINGFDKQFDYLFTVEEGGYYGHPNPLLGNYILNGGNPTAGPDIGSANTPDGGNEYPVGVQPDPDYDLDGVYSLDFNKSPNGATEYTGSAFGANLQGALLITQFSQGDNVRVINLDADGKIVGDDVLRRADGSEIKEYIDPLDIVENPVTGQLYLMTLNRGSGESKIVLLNPNPGGATGGDTTADEGGDLALSVVDGSDAAAVVFAVAGLDADIETVTVSFDGGATTQTVALDGQNRFTADLSAAAGAVTAVLTVADDVPNTATAALTFTPGGGAGSTFIDARFFTLLDTDDGTIIRRLDDPATHEDSNNDQDGDGLNDGHDGDSYLDPNGGSEDKAAFTFDAAGAGTYALTFRMASNSDRSVAIKANGQTETIAVNTGAFTNWQDFTVELDLADGANTVVIAQTTSAGPNVDSVTITPIAIDDTTADEGGDLDLIATDLTDPAQAVFTVSGADGDLSGVTVVFTDGTATVTESVPDDGDFNGTFTVDLSSLTGDVTATLTATDGANTAVETAAFTLEDPGTGNDGTEEVGGQTFVIYEAENAALDGPVVVAEDRTQRGDFVDFDGTADQSVTWTVFVAQAGDYAVDILYALGTGKDARPMALSVNGDAAGTLPFAPNSNDGETSWGPQPMQVALLAGANAITVTAPGANGPNLDYLRISQSPITEPLDLTADEGGDLSLSVIDQADAGAVVFEVAGLDADIDTVTVAFNGGPAQTVTVDANGRFTADTGVAFGAIEAVLTVTDDAANTASASADFSVAPDGDPDAEIEVQSLDAAYFDERLHFSFLENNSGSNPNRSFKDTAVVELSNPGSATLDIAGVQITGPYEVVTELDGASIAPGGTLQVTVRMDPDAVTPKPTDGQNSVYEGALTLITNDADSPVAVIDLAGFYQKRDEGGWEPNVNEVWELFGFGNEIENLALAKGGENSVLNFFDLYLPSDETEVLSPYWRIADGFEAATITQIAAFHGDGGAGMGIHGPGNKGSANDIGFGGHNGDHNQRILPLEGNAFFTETFDRDDIPNGWAGDDVFGIEMAGLSTDPRLNGSGAGTVGQGALDNLYPGYTVTDGTVFDPDGNEVPDGYTVRMFQAVDEDGAAIDNVFLGVMDYTGINYDYNDNMFIIEGVEAAGFGGSLLVSGLDGSAADDRLVFTNIDNPDDGGGVGGQTFRNEAVITLTNDGFGDLDITGLSLGGDGTSGFTVTGGTGVLAPGASVDVTVAFVGQDTGGNAAGAVPYGATLTVETGGTAAQTIALSGLAQAQSESGQEPTVADIVAAFGYATDVAQGQLNNGGTVETVGDEVLMPYLSRLDGTKPVEVINLAAFLQQTNISRLNLHELDSAALTELFAGDDQQGQTVLPDGLVVGDGDTGSVGRAEIDRDAPFGLKVTVDGRPTFAAYTDPEANKADASLGVNDEGHYIRFFQAKDADGADVVGTFIGVQDYPGGGNFDYNDAVFLVTNVQPYALTAVEDGDGDGVNDALQTDADGDGTVAFFDADDGAGQPAVQAPFGGAPWTVDGDGVTVMASAFDEGGQGVAYNDDGAKSGVQSARPDANVDISNGTGAVGYTAPGEWLEYTIDVAQAGTYTLVFNSSSPIGGRGLTTTFEQGGTVYATVGADVPDTDAYTAFADTDAVEVALQAGVQVMRVLFDNGQQDLMSFTLAPVEQNAAPTTSGITDVAGDEGGAFSRDVSGFFSDADGDTLGFTATGLPGGLTISAAGVISGNLPEVAADTGFAVTVTASDGVAEASATFDLTVADVPPVQPGQSPFGGVAPALVDALTVAMTAYDEGGQGVAYNDAPGLQGGSNGGRAGADVEVTGLGDIGWISDGEWLEYTIDVAQDGVYDLDLFLATNGGPGRTTTVDFTRIGETAAYATSGPIANPVTGGWTNFQQRGVDGIALTAGEQVVRVTFQGGSQDARSFMLTLDEPTQPAVQTPVPGPDAPVLGQSLTIDATNFDAGGQGVSWNDDPGLDGGSGGGRPAADVEFVGAEADIGYVEAGEWVEYTIDVEAAGTYALDLIAKTPIAGNAVTASLEDGDPLATFALADSNAASNDGFGGTTFGAAGAQSIDLSAGLQTLRFTFDGVPADGGYLLDFRSFSLERAEAPDAIGYAGTETVTQTGSDTWFSVSFAGALDDPSVVMGPILSTDGDMATVRVRDVTSSGFEFQIDEWDYLDGAHGPATVSWLAVEAGTHVLADGAVIEAGSATGGKSASEVAFGGDGFSSAPVVIAQAVTRNGDAAITTRVQAVDGDGFAFRIDEEEASRSAGSDVPEEEVDYIAFSEGLFAAFEAGTTGNTITSNASDITLDAIPEAFLAQMQTRNGGDTSVVRQDGVEGATVSLFIEEEQSRDPELFHTAENVGWVNVTDSFIFV